MTKDHKTALALLFLVPALLFLFLVSCDLRREEYPPIGGTTHLSGLEVDGTVLVDGAADSVQHTVQAHSTQTSNLFVAETSAGTDLFWLTGAGDMELNGTTPLFTIGDAGAEDTTILFDGNAQDFYAALDDSADDFILGLGSTVGTTGIVYLDENQDVGLGGASAGAKLDVTGNVMIDGAAAEVQLTAQDYTTPTGAIFVLESSDGTDVLAARTAPATAGSFDLLDLTDTMVIQDGTDTVIGIDVNLTGANHTGSSNYVYGLDLDLTTADAQATEVAIELSDTDWDTGIQSAVDQEHIGLLTIDSAAIITTTDGALWTVGTGEIWFVYAVYCEITTNFDCDGDDCTLTIGDGNDTDGFLVLNDAEMQAADAEFTGAPAGWKGLHTDSMGAYLSGLGPFVYDGTDTIDIAIDDTGGTDPDAGAGTCYVVYTRVQ